MSQILERANHILRRLLLATGITKNEKFRRQVFRFYYDRNSWGDAESRSGSGSNMEQTKVIRRELPALFERRDIKTLLDVPCGDGHWWQLVGHGLDSYIGADVVPEVVDKRSHDASPGEVFHCLDIATDLLPKADAILCRDLLVHFSYDIAFKAVRNMKASGAEYLIATTFPGRKNRDIKTGSWRAIDMCAPPFNFPTPLELVNENCTEANDEFADKSLGVWRLGDVTFPDDAG